MLFKRLATAVSKYWVCKRGPGHAAEAMECLGGNGYTEEWPLARVYREQPLLSIWEGSGNVIALDVLRAMARTPAALGVLLDEIGEAAGADARLDAHVDARSSALAAGPRRRWSRARARSSRTWRWRCRARCSCATPRRPSPTRSAPPAWPATAGTPTARCPPAIDSRRSSSAMPRPWGDRAWHPEGVNTGSSIQLVRIFGIRIGVSVSWFVVLFLFIFLLSDTFRDQLGGSQTEGYVVAVVAALLFFASLILHELGHALVAQRAGIEITGIDLWFFGGIAKMSRDTKSPGEEFRVSAAGPAVTLLIVAICVAIGVLIDGGTFFDLTVFDTHDRPRRRPDRPAGLAGDDQRVPVRVQPDPRLPARRRADLPLDPVAPHRPEGQGHALGRAHRPGRRLRDGRVRPVPAAARQPGQRPVADRAVGLPGPGGAAPRWCRATSTSAWRASPSAT